MIKYKKNLLNLSKIGGANMNYKNIVVILLVILASGCASQSYHNSNSKDADKQVEIKGSDTMVQLVSNLAEAYSSSNPTAKLSVTGGGSGTGIAALINGEVDIAISSRAIKKDELKQAEKNGITPLGFIIGRDTLSVVVHKDNPVSRLTIDQISKIYRGEIINWNEIGGSDQKISLYGRQSTSGTYIYFLEEVIKGDYSPSMRNMEGTQAIIDAVKQDKSAIGYVGVGYVVDAEGKQISRIKTISVAKDQSLQYMSPLDQSKILQYPISRPLFQYVERSAVKDPAIRDFLMYELGNDGQKTVKESGFFQVTDEEKKINDLLLKEE